MPLLLCIWFFLSCMHFQIFSVLFLSLAFFFWIQKFFIIEVLWYKLIDILFEIYWVLTICHALYWKLVVSKWGEKVLSLSEPEIGARWSHTQMWTSTIKERCVVILEYIKGHFDLERVVRQGFPEDLVAEPRTERLEGIRWEVQRKSPAQQPSGKGEPSSFQKIERVHWLECREWREAMYRMRLERQERTRPYRATEGMLMLMIFSF